MIHTRHSNFTPFAPSEQMLSGGLDGTYPAPGMLRRIEVPVLGTAVAALGMGCASLGSRISERNGLAALARAHEAGVTWFDVAPPYGAGAAERILGRFAKGRRDQIQICTKVGLIPPAANAVMRALYTTARPMVSGAMPLRRFFRSVPMTRNRPLILTPALIAESVERSLRELQTDYIDVLALHDPLPETTRAADLLGALQSLVDAGKVRALSVAGSAAACKIGLAPPTPFSFCQMADLPGRPSPGMILPANRDMIRISHSVLGVHGTARRVQQLLDRSPKTVQQLEIFGFSGTTCEIAVEFLLRRAFARNPSGIVLMSMFNPAHLAMALRAQSSRRLPYAIVDLIDAHDDILTMDPRR